MILKEQLKDLERIRIRLSLIDELFNWMVDKKVENTFQIKEQYEEIRSQLWESQRKVETLTKELEQLKNANNTQQTTDQDTLRS